MARYKSFLSAINDLIPSKQEMDDLGKELSKSVKDNILKDKVKGPPLKKSTIRKKTYLKAKEPSKKLFEFGNLAESVTYRSDKENLRVGYTEKKHRSKRKGKQLSLSSLARIQNNGSKKKNIPQRTFIEWGNDQINILKKWIREKYDKLQ